METGEPPEDEPPQDDPLRPHYVRAVASGKWVDFVTAAYLHFKGEIPRGFRDTSLVKYASSLFPENTHLEALDDAFQTVAKNILKKGLKEGLPSNDHSTVTGYVATMQVNALNRIVKEGTQPGWCCTACTKKDAGVAPDRCPACGETGDWHVAARMPLSQLGDEDSYDGEDGLTGRSAQTPFAADALGRKIGVSVDPHREDSTGSSFTEGQWIALIDTWVECRDTLPTSRDHLVMDITVWGAYRRVNEGYAPLTETELKDYLQTLQGRKPANLRNQTTNFPLLQSLLDLGHLDERAAKRKISTEKERLKKRVFPCMRRKLAKAKVSDDDLERFFN